MVERYKIAAYTRISVDVEKDTDNTSIENQKAIIAEYCKTHFPTSTVDYYEDRDKSGYTFNQRPCYYYELRPKLMSGEYDILIIKDLSRFSRRTGKGLAEFEDLVENNLRIISIGESIDYEEGKTDDWLQIKLYFFVNEMPVTDASKKVSAVIANRQKKGEWVCSVPYGYVMKNTKKMIYEIDEPAAEVVREIFRLYISGWGYKRIANHLTDKKIPTPRMCEKVRKEAMGDEYHAAVREEWSIITVQEMIHNDFYIGTLRCKKFQRQRINGPDVPVHESQQIVFENHHTPIVDARTFMTAKEQLERRRKDHYRGVKKNENNYSGFLICGDCGSPMFARNRDTLNNAYVCGRYHRRGLAGCKAHTVKVDFLDEVLKEYIRKIRDNSASMIDVLKDAIKNEDQRTYNGKEAAETLLAEIEEERDVLRSLVKQRAKELARSGEGSIIVESYDMEIDSSRNRIEGLQNQLEMVANTTNTMVRVNRVAKTVIDVFNDILEKDHLDKNDINLIISHMVVFEDHIEIKLKAEIDELLRTGTIEQLKRNEESEVAVNFDKDTENIESADDFYEIEAVQRANKQHDKVFRVNVISVGDPLEIYTDREGEVIFKKYSPIGELASFAAQYAETLHKVCSMAVIICDRDAVIASSGVPRREYADKKLSDELESIIEGRQLYQFKNGDEKLPVIADGGSYHISCAMPIISEGDIVGCVSSVSDGSSERTIGSDVESKLILTAAGFLGRQLES